MKSLLVTTMLLMLITTFCFQLNAQKEHNIWYFGENAGLDFNSGVPVPLTNGMLDTWEGCATIADDNGNLLFYTDGITVWDKNHSVMPNGTGLLGNNSSSQSAIIVSKPLSSNIYYIFTVGISSSTGLHYSEVNMNLNSGNGDVNSVKNVNLITTVNEHLTAVLHNNGTDYWVISKKSQDNDFFAFQVSSSGVSATSVQSTGGAVVSGSQSIGCVKTSPDGSFLAVTNRNLNIELYDFDNSTGQISYKLTIPSKDPPNTLGPFGIEFSPSGDLLYYSEQSTFHSSIYQVNLLAGSNQNIINSRLELDSTSRLHYGLQLAPDGKIYIADFLDSTLSVINEPDSLGLACDLQEGVVSLGGQTCKLALPSFVKLSFNISFTSSYFCEGDSTQFNYSGFIADSIVWDFGDPNSGLSNSSILTGPGHVFSDTGSFNVVLTVFKNGNSYEDSLTVNIFSIPVFDLGSDTLLCDSAFILLSPGITNASYLWQDSSVSSSYNVNTTGNYSLTVTLDGCSSEDSINIGFVNCFEFSAMNFCSGDATQFSFSGGTTDSMQWNFGDINSGTSNRSSLTNPMHIFSDTGVFEVVLTVYQNGFSYSDTQSISIIPLPLLNLGADTIICDSTTLLLNVFQQNATYVWQDNSTNATFEVSDPGMFSVTSTINSCQDSDSVLVGFMDCRVCNIMMPDAFSPNQDGVNDFFYPVNDGNCTMSSYHFSIYNRWGQRVFYSEKLSEKWDGTFMGNQQPAEVYLYRLDYTVSNGFQDKNYQSKGQLTLLR